MGMIYGDTEEGRVNGRWKEEYKDEVSYIVLHVPLLTTLIQLLSWI